MEKESDKKESKMIPQDESMISEKSYAVNKYEENENCSCLEDYPATTTLSSLVILSDTSSGEITGH